MYTSFYITELKLNRRIWVYLPNDYAISGKKYPVLYMQDGQNLFDPKESFSGTWEIDEYLDTIDFAGIVVGIDNAGDRRINEYNPNDHVNFGKGTGKQYLEILTTVLKPYVDKNFRTLTGPAHTAIAGSSMGGLISFYAGLYHPRVFGNAGVFSPSFWIVQDLMQQIESLPRRGHSRQRFYFYVGKKEGEKMVQSIESVEELVRQHFKCKTTVLIDEKGRHSEHSWKKMFPAFYEWLLSKK